MKNIYLFSLLSIFFFVSACSSPHSTEPLNEDLSFDSFEEAESQSDLDALDFESSDEESEFAVGDEGGKLDKNGVSFDDFEGSSDDLEEADDIQVSFDDFEESEENKVKKESLADETLNLDDEGAFDDFDLTEETSDFALEEDLGVVTDSPPLEIIATESDVDKNSAKNSEVLSVDYDASQKGGSFLISSSHASDIDTEFIPETNQFVLRLKKTKLGSKLSRPFLTKDFRQSFNSMSSYQDVNGDAKFIFKLKKGASPKVMKLTANKILIAPGLPSGGTPSFDKVEIKKGSSQALASGDIEDFLLNNNEFVGEKISIQAKDEDIVNVINFISEQVGANLVVSSEVTGKVNIKLKNVPWDQALVVLMKSHGLGYIRNGNILRIAKLETLKQESIAAAEVKKAKKTLEPFHVKVFPLSYAQPKTVEAKIKPFLTAAASGQVAGQVISEGRSSSVIIRDTLPVIKNVADLIKELDRPPLQVMIQAKIVEASRKLTKSWESLFSTTPATNSVASGGLNVRLPTTFGKQSGSAAAFLNTGFNFSGIDFLGNLTQRLRISELNSNARVLSSPRVMAINNEKATIIQSDEIITPIVTQSVAGPTTSLGRNKMELKLEVTPQVSSDGNIVMDMSVKREFPGEKENGARPISSREAGTKVIVGNNMTAMIGGVYQAIESKSDSGVPVLRKLPLLKWLFSNKSYTKVDTELVIFITPQIIKSLPVRSRAEGEALDAHLNRVSSK